MRAVWARVFFNSNQQWAVSPYASQLTSSACQMSKTSDLLTFMKIQIQWECMHRSQWEWQLKRMIVGGFTYSCLILALIIVNLIIYVSPSGCNKSSAFYDLFIIATVLADSLTVLTNLFNSHQTWKTKRSYPNKYLGGGEFRWWTAELWTRWAVPGRVFESAWWKSWRITGKKKPLSLHALHAYSMFWSGLLQYQHIYLTGRGVWFRGVWFWWLQFSC